MGRCDLLPRSFVSSCTKIMMTAASGTAVSAPRTPSSAPNSVTATMMKYLREVDGLALDLRRDQVVLDLLVDQQHDEHDDRGGDPFLGPERRHQDESGEDGADVRDHVEQPCDDGQRRA